MGAPPQLTLEERRAALAKAAHSRKLRAEFKAEVKAGQRHWLDAFTSDTEAIRKMRVKELLQSLPGIGEVRAISLLNVQAFHIAGEFKVSARVNTNHYFGY